MDWPSASRGEHRWLFVLLYRLYETLTLEDAPEPAGLIFVLAGRMERKQYGIELYRSGVAPRLLLSVGRFEVSRMRAIDFAKADELIALRDRTAPQERHFFCDMTASGICIERPKLCRWNTYGEVLGLRKQLARGLPKVLIVISTDVHLRRIAMTVDRVFRGIPLEVRYCPVPPRYSSLRKAEWWTRPADRRYVLTELAKLQAYRVILCLPDWMIRWIMRLKS
ncbi:MAG TPA: hypothetical protein VMH28_20725 [Candidatus Acidoferrales bacterium]|nr:hypothetical protein [Candidatus Acidoferrales bacterium]